MTDEATQKGVSESDTSFGADRLAKVNAISKDRATDRVESEDAEDAMALLAKQAEALDDELKNYGDDEPPEPTGEASEDPDADDDGADTGADKDKDKDGESAGEEHGADKATQDATPDDDPDAPESPVFFENGQWMTRIKVDGQIKTVPFAKVHAAAQKLEAGDQRLEEANRLMREIEEREQRLLDAGQSKDQPPAQGADGQGQTETGQPDKETRTLIQQYHEALLNGEDDTAQDLLEKLATAGRQQPHVDVNELAAQVESRVAKQFEDKDAAKQKAQQEADRKKQLQEAYTTFSEEFEDVVKDEQLTAMADRLTLDVAQEHPTYTPLEVMREAGKRTRQWLEEKTGNTRAERKRNLKTVAGNNARQPGKPEEKPPTRKDKLNEIRAARGQATIG